MEFIQQQFIEYLFEIVMAIILTGGYAIGVRIFGWTPVVTRWIKQITFPRQIKLPKIDGEYIFLGLMITIASLFLGGTFWGVTFYKYFEPAHSWAIEDAIKFVEYEGIEAMIADALEDGVMTTWEAESIEDEGRDIKSDLDRQQRTETSLAYSQRLMSSYRKQ